MLTLDATVDTKKVSLAEILKTVMEYRFYGYFFVAPLVLIFGTSQVISVAAYVIIADVALVKSVEALVLQTMKVFQIGDDSESAIALADRWIGSWYMSRDFKENMELIKKLLLVAKNK